MKHISFHLTAILALVSFVFSSCDDHTYEDETWHRWKPGMIYCTNGQINTYEEMIQKGNTPEAVIFYVNSEDSESGKAYAVCIDEYPARAFSDPDTTCISQGTSADITTYDGEKNTATLRGGKIDSPIVKSLTPKYFIPSVAEMYRLYTAKEEINAVINQCKGTPIPLDKEGCWYWTSTECSTSAQDRAWVYSLSSGRFESADKHAAYPTRPIMSIRLNNGE